MPDSTLSAGGIYLAKRCRVIVKPGHSQCPLPILATANKNLEALGFTLSGPLLDRLLGHTAGAIADFYALILPTLQQMVGAHRRFQPVYPNFPRQVMEASDLELYWNAIMHYWSAFAADVTGDSSVIILPRYDAEPRDPLHQEVKLRVIELGSEADFGSIFTTLAGANASLAESDKAILSWFVDQRQPVIGAILPPVIPQKETLAFLAAAILEKGPAPYLLPHLKTATDILRVAMAMSGSNVSLATPGKFRRFRRAERRFLLEAMEQCGALTEDMLRWQEMWKRLGRELRPGDYPRRFPKVQEAFDVVRNDKPFATFNGLVESAIGQAKIGEAVSLLKQRPGVFARRLDHLMRLATDGGLGAAAEFAAVAAEVSTPVLVQAYHHFRARPTSNGHRAFFPKGSVAKVQVVDKPLPPLASGLTTALVAAIRDALVNRFRTLPPLGRVYVDEALQTQVVPFGQRSASRSLRTIARGSRLAIPVGDTIRFFLWWKDGKSRTDIDLSAVFFSPDWAMRSWVTYFNLKEFGCCHSGDITSAPQGACEFIDAYVPTLLSSGVRYVAPCLNSYTQQPYCDLPECFAGWMIREHPQSGEIFEPKTVQDKIDLTANTTVAIPLVIDLVDRQAIWADIALRNTSCINNVKRNGNNITTMARAVATLNRPNLYDLFLMHAEARGTLAPLAEAETVFSLHQGITPFDTDLIASEYLR